MGGICSSAILVGIIIAESLTSVVPLFFFFLLWVRIKKSSFGVGKFDVDLAYFRFQRLCLYVYLLLLTCWRFNGHR